MCEEEPIEKVSTYLDETWIEIGIRDLKPLKLWNLCSSLGENFGV